MDVNTGLTSKQVEERKHKGLQNGDIDVKTKSVKRIIADNLFTLFNLVNLIMALSVAMVHSYKNMLFIGVAVWNMLIGIVQEVRSKRVIDKMSILSQPKATVLRDGVEEEIQLKNVVLNDILVLKSGNQVCADAIVLHGECDMDESLLTGESECVHKKAGDEILSGSFVVSGSVKAEVNHIGNENYAGKITEKVKYLKKNQSEIMKAVKFIIKVVSVCIVPLAVILLYNQMKVTGHGIDGAIINTVAALIGTMPSGLVLLTTIVMEVSVIKLSKHNTLVQDLYCIETLARVDVLCLDKTGTITEGKMQVMDVITMSDMDEGRLHDIMCGFCTAMEDENATLLAVKNYYNEKSSWQSVKTIPFSSDKKWSLASFEGHGTCVLGAAEFLSMNGDMTEYFNAVKKYSEKGSRTLAVAYSEKDMQGDIIPDDLRISAILVINDKIRDNARETIEYFKKQDVDIKIISGDSPDTVSIVARNAGVKDWDKVISTTELTDKELEEAAEKYTVFGRVTPEQKLKLVEILKSRGHIVGMTGDGVNDVMALKEADCSIAMHSGSDAVRSVSQMVLMDSDFSSMPKIVAEGRRTINNIERSATLYLVKTIYSFILAVAFAFINYSYPFLPIQLTLIGALAIGIPSFILAMEPNYDRVEGKFLINVMQVAVPGAMSIIANVVMALIIAETTGANYTEMSTLAAYLTSIASMVILYDLCIPFNLFRTIMFSLLTAIFFGAFNFFKPLFCVTIIPWELIIVVVSLGIVTFLLHKLFVRITEMLFKVG
ncbi:MAG: HAD-IC family P-type ATPase [Lachnospiraceae bacterium]|nr:HAD-IC family P-type ATPase [Lachnospiraceae bacterium]